MPEEVAGYELAANVQVHWLADGDHSFKPRKSSGRTEDQNWRAGVDAIASFLSRVV
jgi:predicted alpha/beta-hydrolase family hydrolase